MACAHEDEAVFSWRRERLLSAGFDRRLATRLAARPGLDLHALLSLVDRGCPPVLAAQILSPDVDASEELW